MVIFALLFTLFLVLLIGVGISAGATLGALGFVLLYRHRRSRRAVSVLVFGGLAALAMSVVVLAATWRYAAWLLPPLIAEQRRFAAERAEEPVLNPALEDMRRFVQAEARYHAANRYFDTPECLARPGACIPGYAGPAFLDLEVPFGTRAGFIWSFHPGAAPAGLGAMKGSSPTSLRTYTVLAVPTAGATEGARSICGDYRGVCTVRGTRLLAEAACPADCVGHSSSEDDARPPLVVGFEPRTGPPGTTVTVTGANLMSMGWTEWRFGGVPQPSYSGTPDQTRLVVPEGAASGKISVTMANGTTESADDFIVEGAAPARPAKRQ